MTTATQSLVDLPVREAVDDLRRMIEDGLEETLQSVLHDTAAMVESVASSGDVRSMVACRERLHRLNKALETPASASTLAGFARGYLAAWGEQLELARTRALGRLAAERDERELGSVREQVLGLLGTPRRPRDLADAIGCDPSQISRAVRELLDEQAIVRVARPDGAADDRRANWYAQPHLRAVPLGRPPAA